MDVKYSVDMLRLQAKVNGDDFGKFMNSNRQVIPDQIDYFQSFRHSDYRHLWRIQETPFAPFSYAVMEQHNMERNGPFHNAVIEFNPNHCEYSGLFAMLLKRFWGFNFLVKQLDMACDIQVPIDNVIYTSTGKQYFSMVQSAGGKTLYFGKRGCGQIKMYDKAAELGMQYGVLTRIEKTMKIDCYLSKSFSFDFASEEWPDFFVPELDSILPDMGAKDALMLLGLRQRPDLIGGLSWPTRKKYAAMLQQQKIVLKPEEMRKAYRKCMARMANELYGIEAFNGG